MMGLTLFRSGTRGFSISLATALVVLQIGCTDTQNPSGYDPTLRFPLREDPLVIRLPDVHPQRIHEVGTLDASILKLEGLRAELYHPKTLPAEKGQQLLAALEEQFGTPANPKPIEGLDFPQVDLVKGSQVYSRICRVCHGLPGDGRGPSGSWMIPPPRDFRSGVFQVARGDKKPRFEDLMNLIKNGVPNSNMQRYDLIAEDELRTVTAYTIQLSQRGEVETRLLKDLLDPSGESEPDNIPEAVKQRARQVRDRWIDGASTIWPDVNPSDDAESMRRGSKLFKDNGCFTCHQDYGRTEGYRFNIWGTPTRVADLTKGEFRWGKSASRLAARIRFGIPAVNMPAHPQFSDAQLADITNFVMNLSRPDKLPDDMRQSIYPGSK